MFFSFSTKNVASGAPFLCSGRWSLIIHLFQNISLFNKSECPTQAPKKMEHMECPYLFGLGTNCVDPCSAWEIRLVHGCNAVCKNTLVRYSRWNATKSCGSAWGSWFFCCPCHSNSFHKCLIWDKSGERLWWGLNVVGVQECHPRGSPEVEECHLHTWHLSKLLPHSQYQ